MAFLDGKLQPVPTIVNHYNVTVISIEAGDDGSKFLNPMAYHHLLLMISNPYHHHDKPSSQAILQLQPPAPGQLCTARLHLGAAAQTNRRKPPGVSWRVGCDDLKGPVTVA